MRRIEVEERPKRKVLYKSSDWRRDSLLEMIGLDPYDANTQREYHRRQGLDSQALPFCIRKDTCPGQHHFFVDCPNTTSADEHANFWGYWA